MKRLYVRFAGDNDFINTVQAFVKAIAPRILLGEWNNADKIDKADIVNLFNTTAFSLYLLHQAPAIKMSDRTTESYLKIKTKDVYFDNEVDAHTNCNHDGCLAILEGDVIRYYIV